MKKPSVLEEPSAAAPDHRFAGTPVPLTAFAGSTLRPRMCLGMHLTRLDTQPIVCVSTCAHACSPRVHPLWLTRRTFPGPTFRLRRCAVRTHASKGPIKLSADVLGDRGRSSAF
jgi:hypothetical protein